MYSHNLTIRYVKHDSLILKIECINYILDAIVNIVKPQNCIVNNINSTRPIIITL